MFILIGLNKKWKCLLFLILVEARRNQLNFMKRRRLDPCAWFHATCIGVSSAGTRTLRLNQEIDMSSDLTKGATQLLLLGAEDSGKSTLMKSARLIFDSRPTTEKRREFVKHIHKLVIKSMKTLLKWSAAYLSVPDADRNQGIKSAILTHNDNDPLNPLVTSAIAELWVNDKYVKSAYDRRREFFLSDGAAFFFNDIIRISDAKYLPTDQDILRVPVSQTAVEQIEVAIDNQVVKIIECGQKTEREKWVHLFERVEAVVFVASLADYDKIVDGDFKRNRLVESMALFHWVVNHPAFEYSAIVLVLTKKDLLEEQLKKSAFRLEGPRHNESRFLDFVGEESPHNVIEYIKSKFLLLATHRVNAKGPDIDRMKVYALNTLEKRSSVRRVLKDIVRYVTDDKLSELLRSEDENED